MNRPIKTTKGKNFVWGIFDKKTDRLEVTKPSGFPLVWDTRKTTREHLTPNRFNAINLSTHYIAKVYLIAEEGKDEGII